MPQPVTQGGNRELCIEVEEPVTNEFVGVQRMVVTA